MFDFFFWRRELLPLPYCREIHCHLIPGVDDGSPSTAFSMKALAALDKFGVEKVIFTPHYTNPRFLNYPKNILPLFSELKAKVKMSDIDIECENFSFEYRMDVTFENMALEAKPGDPECKIRPLKGNHLLIENGWTEPYSNLVSLAEQLQSYGYNLIMAHPERYPYYFGFHGARYHELQNLGIQFQCNVLSFSGYYGQSVKDVAYWMMKKGYVNFLGSDLHNSQHIRLIEKFLRSKRYAEIADDLADMIYNDNIK